jgi:DNA-binding protein
MELPLAPIERIMRDAGAERISPDAVVALSNMLKKRAEEVTEDAIALAKHAGRKTITTDDIQLAGKS